MAKNDIFYKVLFAVELALLPMLIFAYAIVPERWVLSVFIAGVLLVKIWLELFKDKYNHMHTIINAIASVAVFTTLFIILNLLGVIPTAVAVLLIILTVLVNVMLVVFFKKQLPEIISAVDFCYMLFECVAIATFTIAPFYALTTYIGIIALALTGVVSAGYKVYTLAKTLFANKGKRG